MENLFAKFVGSLSLPILETPNLDEKGKPPPGIGTSA